MACTAWYHDTSPSSIYLPVAADTEGHCQLIHSTSRGLTMGECLAPSEELWLTSVLLHQTISLQLTFRQGWKNLGV